jgi:hypothetical protein
MCIMVLLSQRSYLILHRFSSLVKGVNLLSERIVSSLLCVESFFQASGAGLVSVLPINGIL